MAIIYHLTSEAEWEAARGNEEYRAESLALEGFIHCSRDEEQMLGVANRLFSGMEDVLVLDVDTDRLTSTVKHEPSRSGDRLSPAAHCGASLRKGTSTSRFPNGPST